MSSKNELWLLCILFGVSSGILLSQETIEYNWPNVPFWIIWLLSSVTFGSLLFNQFRTQTVSLFVPSFFIIFWISLSFSISSSSDLGIFVWPISYALLLFIPTTITLNHILTRQPPEDEFLDFLLPMGRILCFAVVIDCLLWLVADGITIHHPILIISALVYVSYSYSPIKQINLHISELVLGGSIGFIIFRQINGNLEFIGSFGPTILALSAIIFVGISIQES